MIGCFVVRAKRTTFGVFPGPINPNSAGAVTEVFKMDSYCLNIETRPSPLLARSGHSIEKCPSSPQGKHAVAEAMGRLRQSFSRCPAFPQEKHLKLLEHEALLPDLVVGFTCLCLWGPSPVLRLVLSWFGCSACRYFPCLSRG